ncbi:beta-ketoacyl-ACP synthase II [Aminiphilus sp.]|uniref:beta-ketoacyl-ACP synthase II n=1 Tax=Aminiphilus sp. TaxID=1872488 RepID=UPI002639455A|nr:beta-ketoacyl-ACP synthase II [Aminiphilus sp.]
MRRVVVTGLGVVSPIGHGRENYWRALCEGRSGVGPITLFNRENFPVRIAAEVKEYNPELYMERKEIRRTDRVIQFAVGAAEMAINDARLDVKSLDPYKFGVYVGSAEGGITTTNEGYKDLTEKGPSRVSPFFIPMMISNMPAAYVAIRYGAKGPNICVVTACATANNTVAEAYHAMRRGEADVILAGGAEAGITPICVAGFAAIKALSTKNDDPEHASRPFDVQRDGFVLGEGAGVLVLEELEHAKARNATILAEIVGVGASCDAYHITAPSPDGEGAIRAMQLALESAGWSPEQVDLINAHGTSTPLNDRTEALAISRVFGERNENVLVNSTKSMVGHGLGAAGALEAIAGIQSLVEGIVHPTVNLEEQDPECPVHVVGKNAVRKDVKRFLSNSFGFGGHNCVLAFSRYMD